MSALARLSDIDGGGLLFERGGASATASIERLATSPLGDSAGLAFQNAVLIAALSDDQWHHVPFFCEESLELTLGERVTYMKKEAEGVAKATCSETTGRYCFR